MVPFQNTTRPAKLPTSYGYVNGKNKALWHLKGGGMKKKKTMQLQTSAAPRMR